MGVLSFLAQRTVSPEAGAYALNSYRSVQRFPSMK